MKSNFETLKISNKSTMLEILQEHFYNLGPWKIIGL